MWGCKGYHHQYHENPDVIFIATFILWRKANLHVVGPNISLAKILATILLLRFYCYVFIMEKS